MKLLVRFSSSSTLVTVATTAILMLTLLTACHAVMGGKHRPQQTPGGANQVEGLNGKIGQTVTDGHWRFEVLSAPKQTDHYVLKNQNAENLPGFASVNWDSLDTPHYYEPRPGYTIYTVDCLVTNAQKSVKQLDCWAGNPHTALTDDQGQSYPPVGYDMATHGSWQSLQLPPGSSEPITILFAVPPGAKFKDLVFTLKNNGDYTGHDLRISLDDSNASAVGNGSAQPAGGANQVAGLNGKVGDMFFDGRWRFEVLSAPQQTDKYVVKIPTAEEEPSLGSEVANFDWLGMPHTIAPKPGYTLYMVDCLIKNGQNKVLTLDCGTPQNNTALIDDQGQSYHAIGYDMMTGGTLTTKPLLPGSAERMTVIFAVPPGTKLKEMVFTLRSGGDRNSHDLHIALAN